LPSQSNLSFTFAIDNAPSFEVVRFKLRERASKPFRLTLDLSSRDAKADLDHLIDSPATFAIHDGDAVVRHVHGMVTQFEQHETGFRRTRYRAVLMPDLARCDLRSNCRIFQQKTAMEIITLLLKEAGIQRVRFALRHRPPGVREYCVQYRETDLEFIDRLAADEGLYYNFEHDAHTHTVVFSDWTEYAARIGHIPYQPNAGGDAAQASLRRFSYSRRLRPTHQVLRDRYFTKCLWSGQLQQEGIDLTHDDARYEVYDHPGQYKDTATGERKVDNRIAYERRDARCARTRSDSPRLQPGVSFDLDDHPREELNTGWFVVSVKHEGEQPTSQGEESTASGTHYANRAKVVPWNREWKPKPRLKPRISGTQVADVVGPKGEVVFCDSYGRVKVQFPWDREGKEDETASCWIRVAQGWSGATFGHMAVPRIGQEVLVAFTEGDPDQPIIVGRNPNRVNLPPFELPGAKNMMVMRSNEINGKRNNHLILDDTPGEIQAQLSSDHQLSQLNLGFITRVPYWSGRKDKRGEGFELRTDGGGVLRGGRGLFLSAHRNPNGQGQAFDAGETLHIVQSGSQLARELSDGAKAHNAPALDAATGMSSWLKSARAAQQTGKSGEAILAQPDVLIGTPASVVSAAGADQVQVSAGSTYHVAGKSVNYAIGQNWITSVKGIASHFVYGTVGQVSYTVNLARGDMQIQAQQGGIELLAQKIIQLMSDGDIEITGKRIVLKTENGDSIVLGGPGGIAYSTGGIHNYHGPVHFGPAQSEPASLPSFERGRIAGRYKVSN
jgi:type VI secretion system secreted protein VgrG